MAASAPVGTGHLLGRGSIGANLGNLAILLEYNEDGLRYGAGAKLREAVAEYRKLPPEKLASLGLQNNLAFALFYAGEFVEARKDAETLNPQPKALIVACGAALNGSESGISEARKLTTGESEYKQTVKAAENKPIVPMNSSTGIPFRTWTFLNTWSDNWTAGCGACPATSATLAAHTMTAAATAVAGRIYLDKNVMSSL